MGRHFLQLWTRNEFESHREKGGVRLIHAASNQFSKRGIVPGDEVFIVACFQGELRLLGVLVVWQGPMPAKEAARRTRIPVTQLTWAADHLLSEPSLACPMRFDLNVSQKELDSFRFANGEKPKSRAKERGPDPQTFRGVRELSQETAASLRALLNSEVIGPEKIKALSIRQPYAERILRGEKKIEYRSVPTTVRERVYIYASKIVELLPGHGDELDPYNLPRGVLVGTIEIVGCEKGPKYFHWLLANPRRFSTLLTFKAMPQPRFFYPFGREKST